MQSQKVITDHEMILFYFLLFRLNSNFKNRTNIYQADVQIFVNARIDIFTGMENN